MDMTFSSGVSSSDLTSDILSYTCCVNSRVTPISSGESDIQPFMMKLLTAASSSSFGGARATAALPDGVDLGSLYELAEALAQQGVR